MGGGASLEGEVLLGVGWDGVSLRGEKKFLMSRGPGGDLNFGVSLVGLTRVTDWKMEMVSPMV